MSQIGSGNLFGSLYDPNKRRINAVFNQNPTGQAGQATSFAAAQQSQRDQQARQLAEAQAAAQQQQQQIAAEATAAQQRQQDARQTAMQEQDFKLRQAQFDNQRAIEQQQLEESKRASYAQEAARQNQQQAARGTFNQQQYQRATGGDSMAQAMQNHNARLRGQVSPFPQLNSAWANATEQYFAQPQSSKSPLSNYAKGAASPRYNAASANGRANAFSR